MIDSWFIVVKAAYGILDWMKLEQIILIQHIMPLVIVTERERRNDNG